MFYKCATSESENLTDIPTLPRQRNVSRRIDHGSNDHTFLSTEEYFRQQYFEALDILICQLDQRFDQKDLKVLEEIEKLLIGCCNNAYGDVNPSEELMELYQREINFQNLQVQLAMLATGLLKNMQ